ncbi:hypothetical protein [Longimicrobium terrae]|uniref:Uncharacterized protein n=1 Tax=Longimicrobium terrae TaxID=1639882 RepID=A0A841GSU3_9BACT|nr:hypothetical protein [Longimicrobium terrae]MBB4635085.1 hypothetical protein [Longimicrobium terrae]MBB6069479.1 hypothetical protein [Longimicrobium terrae]NNC31718.1 hypothetical protein [Longimicrobium terrae]
MKKLRLDIEEIAVESFIMSEESLEVGTVRGQQDAAEAIAGGGTIFSLCNTCDNTCDVNAATCGASCGTACRPTVNTPDCYTPRASTCVNGGCRFAVLTDAREHNAAGFGG